MCKAAFALFALILLLATGAQGQETGEIKIERSKVLSQYGQSEQVQLGFPVNQGIGVVATQTISREGASALRLHFKIETPAPGSLWGINISDRKKSIVWSYSAVDSTDTEFWSDEIPKDYAKVEVFSLADVSGLKLTIDRLIVSKTPSVVRSLTVNKLKPIIDQPPQIQGWGKTVARLQFISDEDGDQYLCTGFLLTKNLLLTNNHCIKSDTEMRSALAEFDYDKPGAKPLTVRFKTLIKTNFGLDFTLLRLSTDLNRETLKLNAVSPSENKALLLIQHPAGRPKQVSIQNCKVIGAQLPGRSPETTDFGHGCDTLGGSSGSPVMDLNSGEVIGLHHLGFNTNEEPVNRAVMIRLILDTITDSSIRQELGLPPLQ